MRSVETMARSTEQDERPRRRDDPRDRKPSRYDRDRSRSPARRDERHDERRRERSPPRGPSSRSGGGPASRRNDNESDHPPRRREHATAQHDSRQPPSAPSGRRDGGNGGSTNGGDSHARSSRHSHQGSSHRDSRHSRGTVDAMMGMENEEDENALMEKLMGFGAFRTTKDTKVPGNDRNYAVHKAKTTEYRQYMNRVGGFNRALSPTRQ